MSRNTPNSTKVSTDTEAEASTVAPTEDPANVDQSFVELYRAQTDQKGRSAVRKQVEQARDAAMIAATSDPTKIAVAVSMIATLGALKVDSAKADRPEVPVEVKIAQRVAVLRLAAEMLATLQVTPEGLTFEGELPEVEVTDELREAATKLAGSKITRSVDRHDIAQYIVRAFEAAEADEACEDSTQLTIAQVRRYGALEGYLASPGAIRSNLEGDSAPEGFELIERSADGSVPFSVRKGE